MSSLISLYSGAGGLDLGMEAAGFDLRVAVEMDRDAVKTLRANRDWLVLDQDIHTVSSQDLLQAGDLVEGDVDILVGGPPCQPFSKAGYWATGDSKRLNDPRARTLDAYLRVLEDTKPQVFLLENVPGFSFSAKNEGFVFLQRQIEEINLRSGTSYSISAAQLSAVRYGVPQTRERVFVVGHREGKSFVFPQKTHALPRKVSMASGAVQTELASSGGLPPPRTAWDAIGHLQDEDGPELEVQGKWGALLPSIPEGKNYLFHTDRGGGLPLFGWRRRYWSMLLKLAKALPSWTLTAQPGPAIGPFHWRSRRLSGAEMCALQTFPADYRVLGSIRAVQKQIGNAVPSALAELLGLEIRKQLLSEPDLEVTPTLIPQPRGPIPTPEHPAPVDQRYLHLVGEHAPHPGTGLGPGARKIC